MGNLTSVANVRSWVGSIAGNDTDNALLQRLINEASRTILNYVQRPDFGIVTVTETYSGKNTLKLPLNNYPVIAVNSLTIDGIVITASSSPTTYGYTLEQNYGSLAGSTQFLSIIGSVANSGGGWPSPYGYFGQSPPVVGQSAVRPFSAGINNIVVNYSYGYTVQNEPQTIPSNSTYTVAPNAIYGAWAADHGVSYANGTAMTAVASNPTMGQYVPPSLVGDSPSLVYTFSSADAGSSVLLNYDFTPYDVEQACIEMVGERYRYKGRIGEASRSMGGQETSSYMVRDALTASIKARLSPYRIVWRGG